MLTSLFRNGFSLDSLAGFIAGIVMSLPAIIIGLTFHEAAHAFVAYLCGDPTAKYEGRLTLNPLRHIDPVGFFMLVFLGFGYARPVPVNPNNFRHRLRDDVFVSIAGILTNLILCFLSSVLFVWFFISAAKGGDYNNLYAMTSLGLPASGYAFVYQFLLYFISINLSLAVFNLLPIPPLDGSHIFNDLIFRGRAFATKLSSQLGRTILLVLLLTGVVSNVLSFFMERLFDLIDWAIVFFY